MDAFRKKLQSLTTEKQNQVLVSTSQLQAHQSELERTKLRVKSEEEEKRQREDKKKDISRELSQITQAIRNLFGRCFSTMRIKPVFHGQQQHKESASAFELLEFELDIIHLRIADLLEIARDYKQAVADASTSSSAHTLPQPPTGADLREASVMSVGTTAGGALSTNHSRSITSKTVV